MRLDEHWAGSHKSQDLAWFCPNLGGLWSLLTIPSGSFTLNSNLEDRRILGEGGSPSRLGSGPGRGGLAENSFHPPNCFTETFLSRRSKSSAFSWPVHPHPKFDYHHTPKMELWGSALVSAAAPKSCSSHPKARPAARAAPAGAQQAPESGTGLFPQA